MRRRWLLAVLVTAGCSSSTAGPATLPTDRPAPVPAGARAAVVDRIVDGDTFWVREPGAGRVKVRLLEYDTPERGECYFGEATARLADLTPVGSSVWLQPDREQVDRYGRALRYVWSARGVFVDVEMVRLGMGRALLVGRNDAHIGEMRAAERAAQAARRGLWGSC